MFGVRLGLLVLFLFFLHKKIVCATEGDKIFSLKIKPLLESKCFACHSQKEGKVKGDLDLTSLENILIGGETSDRVLIPGDPGGSLLLSAVKWLDPDYEMPPKENDRLSNEQVNWVQQWIALGAPWPDLAIQKKYWAEERAKIITEEGEIVDTSGGLSDEWTYRRYKPEDLWAFKPISKLIPFAPKLFGLPANGLPKCLCHTRLTMDRAVN